jgi:uncharacterized membrane protein HdeD (DUF308 family)
MIVLGIILIVLGLLLPAIVPTFAFAHIVLVIGVILLVVGVALMLMGRMGHAVGGRRHYY